MKKGLALFFSFLITLVYYFAILIILVGIMDAKGYTVETIEKVNPQHIAFLINIPIAIIMTLITAKIKSGYYKGCLPPPAVFILILIFGPFGLMFPLYQFFQIKWGVAVKKIYEKPLWFGTEKQG